jgi:hypothetical protein
MPSGMYERSPNWHPWNYGLTKDSDSRLVSLGEKTSRTKKLHPTSPWSKELTKKSDVRLANISLVVSKAQKGKHNSPETEYGGVKGPLFKGHNWGICRLCGKDHKQNPMVGKKRPDLSLRNKTPEMREINSLRSLGNTYGRANKGRIVSEETRQKQCSAMFGKHTPKVKRDGYFGNHNWISRREPNKSEQKITHWIEEAGLPFQFTGNKVNKNLELSPDWSHVSEPIYIEFDGKFWHDDEKFDIIRNQKYLGKGCKLLVLSDGDLKNKELLLSKIMRLIGWN